MSDVASKPTTNASQRDRRRQVFLTQARGPIRNGNLLRQAVDRALRMHALRDHSLRGALMDDALIDTLGTVTNALESLEIHYAITGSMASSLYGEVHSTVAADLVLIASATSAARLAGALGNRFYAPEDMLTGAARNATIANVVDNKQGLKVDLSFIGNDPYLQSVIRRRVRRPIGDSLAEFWFVTPEDVILMKLLWRRESQSSKQWNDALGVVQVCGVQLYWKYLFTKARALNTEEQMTQLRDEGGV